MYAIQTQGEFRHTEELSIGNRLPGRIVEIVRGPVMSEIELDTQAGMVTAAITTRSLQRMRLAEGQDVLALIKATELAIEKPAAAEALLARSFRNQLEARVVALEAGTVLTAVELDTVVGPLTAVITARSARRLKLAPGDQVIGVVKATEVAIAREGRRR